MTQGQGYFEPKNPFTGKSPKHQKAATESGWSDLSDAVIVPLVEDAYDAPPKRMKGALAMIDPIKQILDIRNIKYEEKFAFLREALQNINRSRREEGHNLFPDVVIDIGEDSLTIYDNAGGIRKEKLAELFDFGVSGWEGSAKEENPFGQGFLSFVMLFDKVEIFSNNVHAIFDLSEILEKREAGILNLNEAYEWESARSFDTFGRGEFTLMCTKPLEDWNIEDAYDMAVKSGEKLSIKSLSINGNNIPLITFETPYGNEFIDITKYNSAGEKILEGYVEITGGEWKNPEFYYYGLIVGHFYNLPGMRGNVNILDKRYGMPVENRDRWQQSKKGSGIHLTENHIRSLVKDFAKYIVETGTDEEIEKYSVVIKEYLVYEQYRNNINFALIGDNTVKAISDDIKSENPDISEEDFQEEIKERMSTKSNLLEAAERTIRSEGEVAEEYNQKEAEIEKRREKIIEEKFEADHVEQEVLIEEEEALSQEETDLREAEIDSVKEEERRAKRVKEGVVRVSDIKKTTFWVKAAEIPTYLELIKNAEYHGYQIAIAHNSIQAELFEQEQVDMSTKRGKFLPIGLFNYVSTNQVKMKTIGPKTKEEARIEWAINTFINSVPEFEKIDFHIADYEFRTIMKIPGTNIEETKKTTAVAYAEGNDIYMMRQIGYGNATAGEIQGFYGARSLRPYLKYNDFTLENKTIGWGDITLFLRVVNLIAHEMAHSVYNTTDNTQEHFEAMGKIIALFNAVITEHQGRTTLGGAKDMGVKNRRALGVEKGDTVAITYFSGTDIEMEESEIKPTKAKKVKTFKVGDYLLYNNLAVEITTVTDAVYEVKFFEPYTGDVLYDFATVPKAEAIEFPFKKGRLYKDLEYDRNLFVMDILTSIRSNGIKIMEFRDYNETDDKDYRIIPTAQAVDLKVEIFNKKQQAEFVHRIATRLVDKYMNDYGPSSIPELVKYFEYRLPINFQAIQYIVRDKYTDKYVKSGTFTQEGSEEYYFNERF